MEQTSIMSVVLDQSALLSAILQHLRDAARNPELTLEDTCDGTLIGDLLLQVNKDYFKPALVTIRSDNTGQHGWVLAAARLKRIYLRLLEHFSFALGLDPSRLPIPDLNAVARRSSGFEVHWLRLMAPLFYALGHSRTIHQNRIHDSTILSQWFEQINARLRNSEIQSLSISQSPFTRLDQSQVVRQDVENHKDDQKEKEKGQDHRPRQASIYPSVEDLTLEPSTESLETGKQLYKRQSEQLRVKLEAQTRETESLRRQLEELRSRNEDLTTLLDTQEQSIDQEGLQTELQAELEEMKESLKMRDQELANLRIELESAKETKPATDMACIEEIAVLEIEVDTLRSRLNQEMARRQQLESQLESQTYLFNSGSHQPETEKLEQRLEQLSRTKGELEIKYAGKKEQLAETMAELESLKAHQSTAIDATSVQEENAMAMERMIEALDSELAQTQVMLQASSDRIKQLESDLSTRMDQEELIFTLQSRLAHFEAQPSPSDSNRKIQELEGLVVQLEEDLAAMQLQATATEEHWKARLIDAEKDKYQLKEKIIENEESMRLAQEELNASQELTRQDNSKNKARLAELEQENQSLRTTIDSLKSTLEEQKVVSAQLEQQNQSLRVELEHEKRSLRAELEELETKHSKAKESMVAEVEHENQALRTELDMLKAKNSEAEESLLAEMERENQTLRSELDELKSKQSDMSMLAEIEQENPSLRAELDDLKAKQSNVEASETIQKDLADNKEHLKHLLEIQEKIDQVYSTIDIEAIEQRTIAIKDRLVSLIEAKHSKVDQLASGNQERLQSLNSIQSSIEMILEDFEPARILPLTQRIDHLEALLIQAKDTLANLKEQKAIKPEINPNNLSPEHKMILAAWHDLGMKIMKMKTSNN